MLLRPVGARDANGRESVGSRASGVSINAYIDAASVVIRAENAVFTAATLDIAATGHIHVQRKK
ncbi:MAG: hypothetical protein JOY54_19650 [Acidobacteriaceae bacterium]|nr:hypothetical protein [Acidobacteriaceae bacterium]